VEWWGSGTERRGSDVERAIGGIFGVYGQARIEERGPPMIAGVCKHIECLPVISEYVPEIIGDHN
jgi:hypothetical protein